MVRAYDVQRMTILVLLSGLCFSLCIMGGPTGNLPCRRRLSFKSKPSSAPHVQVSNSAGQKSGNKVDQKVQLQQDMKIALNWYAYW